ncbi:hypothetical protein DL771_005547 [Monosporascus sp. 5C6A]|nr:hypothetical protein DL771_005547 [Monosporascus sp. 5C6A]
MTSLSAAAMSAGYSGRAAPLQAMLKGLLLFLLPTLDGVGSSIQEVNNDLDYRISPLEVLNVSMWRRIHVPDQTGPTRPDRARHLNNPG